MSPRWTPLRTVCLEDLWQANLRVRLIAELLGTTRNAVISKAKRLRLPKHKNACSSLSSDRWESRYAIINYYRRQEYSDTEIGELLGLTASTVKDISTNKMPRVAA